MKISIEGPAILVYLIVLLSTLATLKFLWWVVESMIHWWGY